MIIHPFFEERNVKEEKVYRIIEVIAAAAVSLILVVIILLGNQVNYVYKNSTLIPNIIFALFVAAALFGYFFLMRKGLLHKSQNDNQKSMPSVAKIKLQLERSNLILLSVILLGIQIVVAWQIYFKTGWDCAQIVQMAQRVAFDYDDIGRDMYFSMYPNNVLLVAVFAAVLRFTKYIGLNADYFPLVMIGCLMVNMAGFFMADCIRKLTKRNWLALIAWGVYMLLAGLSPWISIPYSDTYSILFPILCIWLYTYRDEKSKLLVWGGIGFAGGIGYFIKPTVILVVYGIIALEIWNNICSYNRRDRKKCVRNWITVAGALFLSMLLAAGFNDLAREKMGFTPIKSKEFTPMHYAMMGLNYTTGGTYDQTDVNFSAGAPSVKERNNNALEEIGNRISDMGVTGLAAHTVRKMLTNFNDGTFAWGKEGEFYWNIQEKSNGLANQLRSYYYDSGSNYEIFHTFSQAMWVVILCLIVCIALPAEEKSERTTASVLLGILGIICFVMLFEARARYLYLYSPLFILAAAIGWERFLEWTKAKTDRKTAPQN